MRPLGYSLGAETTRQSVARFTSAGTVRVGHLCAHPPVTVKAPTVFILGLQMHFSRYVNPTSVECRSHEEPLHFQRPNHILSRDKASSPQWGSVQLCCLSSFSCCRRGCCRQLVAQIITFFCRTSLLGREGAE